MTKEKIRKILSGKTILDLSKRLLLAVTIGEKLSKLPAEKNLQIMSGLRRYKFVRQVGKNHYALTAKGRKRINTIIIDQIKIKTPKTWDGKWYLVIYDLPLRFKKIRESFRWKLKDLGFFQFQKSAWIYPYSCEKEILDLVDFYGVRNYIEILEVNKILNSKNIQKHFNL